MSKFEEGSDNDITIWMVENMTNIDVSTLSAYEISSMSMLLAIGIATLVIVVTK